MPGPNTLRNIADWLEDRSLRPHEIQTGEELVFEIEQRRQKMQAEFEAADRCLAQLMQPTDNPATLAAEAKAHARELEKAIRQFASLLMEFSNRLQDDEGE